MRIVTLLAATAAAVVGSAAMAQAQTEIQWWHAMTGVNNEVVEELAKEFNASQKQYKVVPVFKGSYPETLNAGIAAFRAHKAPDIIQVFDVGTGVMMGARGAVKPIGDLMKEAGEKFDPKAYLPGIVSYYSTAEGKMLSFPYNSSSPILYYNKTIFKKAGLDPNNPPKTWPDVFAAARKIKETTGGCGFTTTWMTWIQLENFAAWNNIAYASDDNGLKSLKPHLEITQPLYVKHFQAIADLAKDGVFRYGGRTSEAKNLFLNGTCAILTESSGGLGDIVKSGVDFGTGPLPYYPEAKGAPQNTIPGGASLWVFGGKTKEKYKGIAEFFAFLSQTPIQVKLHEVSGYLPATMAAYEATKKSGFYDKNPGRETPILQMMGKPPTANSRGVRLVDMPEVRDIQDQEFEAMLAGKQDAKTALEHAQSRGNAAILAAAKKLGK